MLLQFPFLVREKGALIDRQSLSCISLPQVATGLRFACRALSVGGDFREQRAKLTCKHVNLATAYRAGIKLEEKETGYMHDYTRKSGVIYSEIFLPANAPQEYQNREILWNEVQKVEKKSDAQLAREIEVALPVELSREDQITLLQKYIAENFTSAGMCADMAIHEKHVDGCKKYHY